MKCEICGKEKEYFGCIFQIRAKTKYKYKFYICRDHVPYSTFTITKEAQQWNLWTGKT